MKDGWRRIFFSSNTAALRACRLRGGARVLEKEKKIMDGSFRCYIPPFFFSRGDGAFHNDDGIHRVYMCVCFLRFLVVVLSLPPPPVPTYVYTWQRQYTA